MALQVQDDLWLPDTGFGIIDDDALSTVSWSARIASCFLELEKVDQDLESKLRDDFNNILNSMDRLSLSPTPLLSSTPHPLTTRMISSIHNSSFTSTAYSWLLENIANPYPSSTVKASLAQRYDCRISTVSTWFVNARRRMGWTALCRDYFNNCRADTLDAAHRALVREDPSRPLSPAIVHAFVCVKATVEYLHSSTFAKSPFTGHLDAVVRDVTDQDTISACELRGCALDELGKSLGTSHLHSQKNKHVAPFNDGSPDRSFSSSPVPPLDESITDDSEEEAEVISPVLAGRKRRLSCLEPLNAPCSKRTKHTRSTPCHSVETGLSSLEEPSGTRTPPRNQEISSALDPPSSTDGSASRKQHLSNVDAEIPRPLELTIGPPLRSVSDPLPFPMPEIDYSLDEWFRSNFDNLFALPPPVDIIKPDLSTQWEVELFSNYIIPPEESQRPPLRSLTFPTAHQSTLVDMLELDRLLRSLDRGRFGSPLEVMSPPFMFSVPDLSVPQDPLSSPSSVDWRTSDPLDFIFG